MTSVDLPEPDTPVTAVSTPSGTSTETSSQVVPGDAAQVQPAVRRARAVVEPARPGRRGGRWSADSSTCSRPGDRAAVEHPPAALPGAGADVDDPVGPAYDVQVVLDDEQRVARGLEPVQHVEQRLRVGRVQAGGRLVEHVDDAEQARAQLGRDPQPLRLAGGQRRRAAPEAEVAEAEVEQHLDARDQVGADPDARPRRSPPRGSAAGGSELGQRTSGSALTSAIGAPAKVTASASGRSPLPPQTGQGTLRTNRMARSRDPRRSWSRRARACTCLRALQNVPW